MMNYQQACSWLFEQFPSYQQQGASAYKPDLDNIVSLCQHYEITFQGLRFIHVAGTNGKGSTCNFLASIYQEAGFKTALFTSPHLVDFRERIRINGEMINEQDVIAFVQRVKQNPAPLAPSFFEISWLMALNHFQNAQCDLAIIETGLGGRLDATNIITPLLSIITTVGLDHTAILGNTIEAIAFEKAGIIKAGVPVICGVQQSQAIQVIHRKANDLSSPVIYPEQGFKSSHFHDGHYQFKNESLVFTAVKHLNEHFPVSEQQFSNGIERVVQNTGFKARMQKLRSKPDILADAGHNTDGIQALLAAAKVFNYPKVHVLFGASSDKDVFEMLHLFPDHCELNFCCFSNPRSMQVEQWGIVKEQMKINGQIFRNIHSAWEVIEKNLKSDELVLVCGSFFLLSDFFSFFSEKDL